MKRFERAMVHAMERIGADTSEFASETSLFPAPAFRHGGSPGEWRTNLVLIRDALDDLERREPRFKQSSTAKEIRETTYAVVNAMRRSDDAAFKRILRWVVDHYPVPDPFLSQPNDSIREDDVDRFARIGEAVADAYDGRRGRG